MVASNMLLSSMMMMKVLAKRASKYLLFWGLISIVLIRNGTPNPRCNVCPPALKAAAPVGANTAIVSLLLNIFLTTVTSVFIHVLLPLPATPETVTLRTFCLFTFCS